MKHSLLIDHETIFRNWENRIRKESLAEGRVEVRAEEKNVSLKKNVGAWFFYDEADH